MGEITHAATTYLMLSYFGMILLFLLIFARAFVQFWKTRKIVLQNLNNEPKTNSKA